MLEFKKMLATLLMPLPALLIIGFLGLFLIWFSGRKNIGATLVSVTFLGLLLTSFQPLTSSLLMNLERQHSPFFPSDKPVDFVMVLGDSHILDEGLPTTSELSRSALTRLVEGIRIHFMYPSSKLILFGKDNSGDEALTPSHAQMLARVAVSMEVDKNSILLLEEAHDLRQATQFVKPIVGNKNLVLVTSASTMTRAQDEFEKAGIKVEAAPTDFLAQDFKQSQLKYTPRAQYLEQFEKYWGEQLRQWWQDS
ncbi:MAG: ElyC/SanA/YdcF family protein [Enterovibrio sp.]